MLRGIVIEQLKVGMLISKPLPSAWVPVTNLTVLNGSFLVYDLRTANGASYDANSIAVIPK